jgi:hypothetical protein
MLWVSPVADEQPNALILGLSWLPTSISRSHPPSNPQTNRHGPGFVRSLRHPETTQIGGQPLAYGCDGLDPKVGKKRDCPLRTAAWRPLEVQE